MSPVPGPTLSEAARHTGVPVWFDGRDHTGREPLRADRTAEVVVVGAGIAGVSTAWELTRAGHEVVLLEARTVGAGTTGGSTAKVSVLQGTTYGRIARAAGPDAARRYAQSQQLAVAHLASVVDRVHAGCALQRRPSWLWAEGRADVEALATEDETLVGCDVPVVRGADPALPFGVLDTLRLDDQLLLDPMAYLDALVVDLEAHGGTVHEHTPLVDLEPGDPTVVATQSGPVVRARHVVLTTHFPPVQQGVLFARLKPRREHVLLVEAPVAPPPGMYVGVDGFTLRPVGDRWLVSGAPFQPGSADAAVRLADLQAWTADHLPGSTVLRTWSAQDFSTPDGLPYIGSLDRRGQVWGATGFGGWGIANGVLTGVLLRDMIENVDDAADAGTGVNRDEWADLFATRRSSPVADVRQAVAQGATFLDRAVGDRLRDVAARAGHGAGPDDLAPGEGARISVDGQMVAAYRDDDGRLHTMSASCPHMGCLVDFEAVAAEWQCPCHGSRFDAAGGQVLEGPATHGLARVDGADD